MSEPQRILVLHGPNLNLLGTREPEVYGSTTLEEIEADLAAVAKAGDAEVQCFQSNHEGALIDRIHEARSWADGILINPGGLTHTSVALRDARVFRQRSLITPIAVGIVSGFGPASYRLGLEALLDALAR
jgi:3-dehydroquinate dehydratase II